MKVLLIGATGNLGLRLVAALLTHHHTVIAYVRSSHKLESLLPSTTYRQITVIEGDAKDPTSIKRAILDSNCEAVVNTAGLAALAPWKSSDLPVIFKAVVSGIRDASQERGKPLRTWVLGGLGVLHYPGTETMLSNYIPIYLEHRQNLALLRSLPANSLDWSMLCPADMTAESTEFGLPAASSKGRLIANAGSPPNWHDSWMRHIPLLGKPIVAGMNATRYATTLEQAADFIASDVESGESQYFGATVGVIDPSK